MMITFEKAIQKSITRPFLSVHHTNLLCAFCQEQFVLSTTQRFVAPSTEGFPFLEMTPISWRSAKYNTYRPHSALDGLTPADYAAQWRQTNQPGSAAISSAPVGPQRDGNL